MCNLEARVSKILSLIKIPHNMLGAKYLKRAVVLAVEDNTIVHHLMSRLYPEVARQLRKCECKKKCKCPQNIERNIRHALAAGWERSDFMKPIGEMFGIVISAKDRPANGEFISFLAEQLLIEKLTNAAKAA